MGTVHVLEAVRAGRRRARGRQRHHRQVLREPRVGVGLPRGRADGRPRSRTRAEGLRRAGDARVPALVLRRRRAASGVASARAGNVIGGGDWGEDRLVPDIMRAALAGEPAVIRNPDAIRPWQHVLEPAERLPAARRARCGTTRRARRRPGTSGPTTTTPARCGGSSSGSATLWPASRSLGAATRARTRTRRSYLKLDSSQGARAARLAPALGPRRRAREDRRLVRALRDGRRPARAHARARSTRSRPATAARRPRDEPTPLPLLRRRRSTHVFADLGMSPLANSYLDARAELTQMEPFYPLRALVCTSCFLVQLEEYETPDAHLLRLRLLLVVLDDLARALRALRARWRSSASGSARESRSSRSRQQRRLPAAVLRRARRPGARRRAGRERRRGRAARRASRRWSSSSACETARELARRDRSADLLLGNNVLAHVPDLNDFVGRHEDPARRRAA